MIWEPRHTELGSISCHFGSSGFAGISPLTSFDLTTKSLFGFMVKRSIFFFGQREITKFATSQRWSSLKVSINEGIGVPLRPVETSRKIFLGLYGSPRFPLKFQHLCRSAGRIGNPHSSFCVAFPSPRPSFPWHSAHLPFFIKTSLPFSILSLEEGISFPTV